MRVYDEPKDLEKLEHLWETRKELFTQGENSYAPNIFKEVGKGINEDDEYATKFYLIEADLTDEEVKLIANYYFPYEHCTHSYDCCGNWYGTGCNVFKYENRNDAWLIMAYWNKNI